MTPPCATTVWQDESIEDHWPIRTDTGVSGSTETFGPGLHVDVLLPPEPAGAPAALVWHGRGPGERLVMRAFGIALASAGIVVVVPDHRPFDPDGGGAVLRESVDWFERRTTILGTDRDRHALVGWSYGARAAAGLLLTGGAFRRGVVLAGSYGKAPPTAASPPMSAAIEPDHEGAFLVIHGTRDVVNPPSASIAFHERLADAGVDSRLLLVPGDHSTIVAGGFEPSLGLTLPQTELTPDARTVLEEVAGFIRGTAGGG